LLAEVLQHLSPQPGDTIVDCTLGGAGHSVAIAKAIAPTGTLVGVDRDAAALTAAQDALRLGQQATRTVLIQGDFRDLDRLLTESMVPYANGFLFDLGVSSYQLDAGERGFSYRADAPLDMRMDPTAGGISAADVVQTYQESDLARVIREYGEERWASRIAAFIVAARARRPISTTTELVDIVKSAVPAAARKGGPHPARRTFQALRIEVNQELTALEAALRSAVRWLTPGGRVVVIAYHSLEDRIAKQVFVELARTCTCPPDLPKCVCGVVPVVRVLTRKAVVPMPAEIERNPRARSAKLRAAQKL
jgi:16S rRNA (cytosine1402-N4)-methyltransferase